MTSEGSEGGGPGVDCSEGTIVWVRRRNGSWWPGRILGQHELAASHLLSPRSGTPVKLLGREDASVDWYNLEKSKRVKAFRCGEFDECIERVEASPGIPIKKREKYARREDAILHALELERQMLEEGRSKTVSSSVKQPKALKKETEYDGYSSRCKLTSEEPLAHANINNYIKEEFCFPETNGDIFCAEKRKSNLPFSWEGNTLVNPSLTRLQSFGNQAALLGTNVRERNIVTSSSIEVARTLGNHLPVFLGSSEDDRLNDEVDEMEFRHLKTRRIEPLDRLYDQQRDVQHAHQSSAELTTPLALFFKHTSADPEVTGRADQIISSKRSRNAQLSAESKDYFFGPGFHSDHVNTIPSWIEYPPSLGEQDISSGFIEPDDYNLSERLYLDPDVDEEHTLIPGTRQSRYYNDDYHTVCLEDDENFNGMSLPSAEASTSYHQELSRSRSSSTGVNRWTLKGKRNDRHFLRRGILRADGIQNRSVNPIHGKSAKRKSSTEERSMQPVYMNSRDGLSLPEFCEIREPSLQLHGNHHSSSWLKEYAEEYTDGSIDESDDDYQGLCLPSWEAEVLAPALPRFNPEFDGRHHKSYIGQFQNKVRSRLIDVDIKVQASSRGEHVPLISLMSRLNGKAIVGHPIPIEKLSSGSTDGILSRNDPGEYSANYDGNASPPSSWRTGRRSLMQRVPRLHPTLPMLDGPEINFPPESKSATAKVPDPHFDHNACKINKSVRSKRAMHGKSQMETPRRLRSCNLKMDYKHDNLTNNHEYKHDNLTNNHDSSSRFGVVKPLETICVTCVPTKVVFSRILEAVRSPPCATSVQETPPEFF